MEAAKERGKWELLGCTAWFWKIPPMLLVAF